MGYGMFCVGNVGCDGTLEVNAAADQEVRGVGLVVEGY